MCKYNHKKAIKNKCLSISITLALMSCVLLQSSAQANTIDMHVEQGAMNSLVGRLGVGLGKDVGKTSFYAKVSLAHD